MIAAIRPTWKLNRNLPVGEDAAVQQFSATVGGDRLVIEITPGGDGALKINGVQIATVDHAKGNREAFRDLKKVAERFVRKRQTAPAVRPAIH
jgi:enoyl-[acyl-carrier protein] reductase I